MNKILLIDGNSLMFRSYYATAYTGNLMKNSKGLYTNAIFGFVNMITKLLSDKYEYVFVAFDKGKHTFRHQAYDDYKGGRKPMPDEFRVQIPYIKKYLDLLNVKHVEVDEYEADDLIASVSKLAADNNIEDIMVVTGDKDLLQLVKGNIHVSLTKKGITELEDYTKDNFFDKMGFYANQIPDYKGLVGDSSDNLPGIKGIGEKTALKLLLEYKSLEGIIDNIDNIKGKVHDTILNGKDTGVRCKNLATLVQDIKLDFTINDLVKKEINKEKLIDFYNELEFKTFIKRLEKKDNIQEEIIETQDIKKEEIKVEYNIVDDIEYDFSSLEDRYIVVEVFGNNYYKGDLLGIGLYSDKDDLFSENIFVTKNVILHNNSFKEYMNSSYLKKTFDYKRLFVCLKKYGIEIKNVCFDLLLASYLINPLYASDDFEEVINNFSPYSVLKDSEVYGSGVKQAISDIKLYSSNCLAKCKAISLLENDLLDKLNEGKLINLFNMEIRLSEVLGSMELDGLIVDKEKLNFVGEELNLKMLDCQKEIYNLAGEEFNINSVKQLGEILFNKLHLPTSKKNKTGFSTNVEVLEELSKDYEIAKKILEYRAYSKLISTYVNGMILVMDENDFIHPLYKQALTMTGRLSSIEPNIQNMPIRTELGQVIRDVFISRFENGMIMSVDYSQIELRVLAHMANDEGMIKSFNSGEDFHTETASFIFSVPVNEVTKNMRRTAKAINFGIVYGMSAWGLSESIGISPKEASIYINKYFEKYHSIDDFIHKTVNDAKQNGYTLTMFNRIRYIKELSSMNRNIYSFGERTAMNAPIQGTAADIIKMAMVKVFNEMKYNNVKSKLIAQVHDELVFDIYPGEEEMVKSMVVNIMENVVDLKVKLIAKADIGVSWLKA